MFCLRLGLFCCGPLWLKQLSGWVCRSCSNVFMRLLQNFVLGHILLEWTCRKLRSVERTQIQLLLFLSFQLYYACALRLRGKKQAGMRGWLSCSPSERTRVHYGMGRSFVRDRKTDRYGAHAWSRDFFKELLHTEPAVMGLSLAFCKA